MKISLLNSKSIKMSRQDNAILIKKIVDKLPPDVSHEIIQFATTIHPQYKDRLLDIYALMIEHVYAIDREQTSGVLWEFSSNEPPSEGSLIIMDFAGMYMLGEMVDGIYYNYHSHMAVRPPQRWRYLHV